MSSAKRQNGFVLLAVVVLMGLMGTGLAVWAAQSRDLSIHTKIQTVQVQLDNAVASVAQWAKVNRKTLRKNALGQPVRLDISELQMRGLECQYRLIDRNTRTMKIEITAVSGNPRCPARKTIQLNL